MKEGRIENLSLAAKMDFMGLFAQHEAEETIAEERVQREEGRVAEVQEQLRQRSAECENLLRRREDLREQLKAESALPDEDLELMKTLALDAQNLDKVQDEILKSCMVSLDNSEKLRHEFDEVAAALDHLCEDAKRCVEEMRVLQRESQEREQSLEQLEKHVGTQKRENQRLISERLAFEAILRRTTSEVSQMAKHRDEVAQLEIRIQEAVRSCEETEGECSKLQAVLDAQERCFANLNLVPRDIDDSEFQRMEEEVKNLDGSVRGFVNKFGLLEDLEKTPNFKDIDLLEYQRQCTKKLQDADKLLEEQYLEEQRKIAQEFRIFRQNLA